MRTFQHLIPHFGFMILVFGQGIKINILENLYHLVAAFTFGQKFQSIDHTHHVPTQSAAPAMRRLTGFGIAPEHRFAFVPTMTIHLRGRIVGMLTHYNELTGHIFEISSLLLGGNKLMHIFSIIRSAHIQTIQPHLMRINLLVPETAVLRTRMRHQLRKERIHRNFVASLAMTFVHIEKHLAGTNMVDIVVGKFITGDDAFFVDHRVDIMLGVVPETFVACGSSQIHKGQHFDTRSIVPLELSVHFIQISAVGNTLHFAFSHPNRQRFLRIIPQFFRRFFRLTTHQNECRKRQDYIISFHCLRYFLS